MLGSKTKVVACLLLTMSTASCISTDRDSSVGLDLVETKECQLFAEAYRMIKASENKYVRSLLAGCSGRERDHKVSARQQRQYQLVDASATYPASVLAKGPDASRLYRKLLLRGTPPYIAKQLSLQDVFINAI